MKNTIEVGHQENIEYYLKLHGFILDSKYESNLRYRRNINDCQTLYVTIYGNVNKIVDVQYEHIALTDFEKEGILSLETVDSLDKLKYLLKALGINSNWTCPVNPEDIPEEYNYVAQDKDGAWFAFKGMPTVNINRLNLNWWDYSCKFHQGGICIFISKSNPDWRNTVQKIPR
jgi:hypothetical protein